MALSFEEALDTLEAMFGAPWTRADLEVVLRHHNGHMENTVNTLLAHGDKDPKELVEQLKIGDAATKNDAELARQLAQEERRRAGGGARSTTTTSSRAIRPPAPPPPPKGRGTLTTLPPDFLRVPGQAASASPSMDQDEQLARMLQDELFSQELARNPEFAHLARGRPRTVGGRPTSTASGTIQSRVGEMPRRTASGRGGGGGGPDFMDKISEMGENAKKRLQVLAAQFNQQRARATGGGGGANSQDMVVQEQRGLLDGDGDDGEEMELTFSRAADSKKNT